MAIHRFGSCKPEAKLRLANTRWGAVVGIMCICVVGSVLALIFSIPLSDRGDFRARATSALMEHNDMCLLSIGVCGLEGVATMRHTLQSYQDNGLLAVADQAFVYYNRFDRPLKNGENKSELVRKFHGWEVFGSASNSKFLCINEIVKRARCKYLVFLEEDFVLVETFEVVQREMGAALHLLASGEANVVRLRSRFKSGSPNYAWDTFNRTGRIADTHLLHSIHWSDDPSQTYPGLNVHR